MSITLIGPELQNVPEGVELHGQVEYGTGPAERYTFQFPAAVGEHVSLSGNSWLVMLLPLAVTHGEALRLSAPIDDVLYANVHRVMELWAMWDPRLKPVPIEVHTLEAAPLGPDRTGQFFTGGIDSFFTAGSYEVKQGHTMDDFIFIHGFDIPLENQRAWRTAAANVQRCSELLNKNCVLMTSNLRKTRWRETRWPELSHGAAMIGAGLTLEDRYRRLVIPASWNDRDLRPWGSHPSIDVLFSTSQTQVEHYGNEWTRVERTEWVVESPIRDAALGHLRVCSSDPDGHNCGHCGKCLRTMLSLDLLGALDEAASFPVKSGLIDRISRLYLDANERILIAQIETLADREGRWDVLAAINASLARSLTLDRIFKLPEIRALGFRIKERHPRVWQALRPIRSGVKMVIKLMTNTGHRRLQPDEAD